MVRLSRYDNGLQLTLESKVMPVTTLPLLLGNLENDPRQ